MSSRTSAMFAVLGLQLVVCVVLLIVPLGNDPHRAPVTISAPAVVATALAEQANSRDGAPLDAGVAASPEQARRDVEQGRAVAAVVIDLRLNRATLLVSAGQGEALSDAVSSEVRQLAEPFSATVTTRDVGSGPAGSAAQRSLRLLVGAAVLMGLGIAMAAAWRDGPVTDTWSQAARRVAVTVGITAVGAVALAAAAHHLIGGSFASWWAVLALTVLATTAATFALAGVLGAAGIGLAALVFVVSAAPLARVEHPMLLPAPWSEIVPWLPHGASLDAARQVGWYDGSAAAQPVVVLVVWLAVSCLVLAVARRERLRAGVVWGRANAR